VPTVSCRVRYLPVASVASENLVATAKTRLVADEHRIDTCCEAFATQRSGPEVQDYLVGDRRPSRLSRKSESERDSDLPLVESILRRCFEESIRHLTLEGFDQALLPHSLTVLVNLAAASFTQ